MFSFYKNIIKENNKIPKVTDPIYSLNPKK